MKDNIHIVKYNLSIKDDIIELLGYQWNNLSYIERCEKFSWRYENNPFVNSPLIYLAVYQSKIIGMKAYVVQRFKYDNSVFNVASAADAIVHPEFRGKGVLSSLNKYSIQDIEIHNNIYRIRLILNLSSNEVTTYLSLKESFLPLGVKSILIKYSLYNLWLQNIKQSNIKNNIYKSYGKHKVVITKDIMIDHIVKLSDVINDTYKIKNEHGEDYYRWKYSYQNNKYYYGYCFDDEQIAGYLIIKKITPYKYSLEEYGYKSQEILKIMLDAAFQNLRIPAMKIFNVSLSDDDKCCLNNIGFKEEAKIYLKLLKKKRLPALIKLLKMDDNDNKTGFDESVIYNHKNWKIYGADIH